MIGSAPDLPSYHAGRSPDAIALADGDTGATLTWAALEGRVARLATVLREHFGVAEGDRVCLVGENDLRTLELQFACLRAGALYVPLNWRLSAHELQTIVGDAEPIVLVHDGAWRALAVELAERAGIRRLSWDDPDAHASERYDDVLAAAEPMPPQDHDWDQLTHILYTSGTTGTPKGALSTHGTMFWQAANLSVVSKLAAPANMLCVIPLFHAGGLLTAAMPVLHYGGRVTIMRRFDPAAVFAKLLDPANPVTHLSQIPAMYAAIAAQPGFATADLSAMRCGVVAGAIAPPDLVQAWWDRGARLQPQYGGTEMGPCALVLDTDDLGHALRQSQGRPPLHTEVRLVDPATGSDAEVGHDGEIWVRGPSVSVGYWRREKSDYFAPGDWLRTGDVARRDEDGYHYFTGRVKEMYKSGGENVYPAEVELVLANSPEVGDIAVVGVDDAKWGEVGLAVIVAAPGTTPTLESVREFGAQRLARYKLPLHLVVVDELARNVTGKVSRAELRARYAPIDTPIDVSIGSDTSIPT
jgi:fatty-acyl-CoA synthase